MKNSIFACLVLGAATSMLGACGGETQDQSVVAPAGVPGLSAANARLVLAPVEGNPGAVYFDLSYDGEDNIAVSRASVQGAQNAVMHQMGEWDGKMQMMEMLPFVMKKGEKVSFEPGGKHIMAMDVSPELKPGSTTEITVTVAGGDKISFPAEIRAAGEER